MKTILIASMSIDGVIAENKDQNSPDLTTKADLKFFVAKTKEIGSMVFGSNTYKLIGHPLKDRLNYVLTSKPEQFNDSVEALNVSAGELIKIHSNKNMGDLAICGGAKVYDEFLSEGLVDEMYISIIPRVIGHGIKLFSPGTNLKFELVNSLTLEDGQTVSLHYKKQA